MIEFFIIAIIVLSLWIVIEIIKKLLIKWFAERTVNKMLADIRDGKTNTVSLEDPKYGIIEIQKEGFQIQKKKNKKSINIEWHKLSDIYSYKRDLVTTDMICLGWKLISNDEIIETHEEMFGFKKLCEVMMDKFKTIPSSWYMDVATPAFETNLTLLWSKSEQKH